MTGFRSAGHRIIGLVLDSRGGGYEWLWDLDEPCRRITVAPTVVVTTPRLTDAVSRPALPSTGIDGGQLAGFGATLAALGGALVWVAGRRAAPSRRVDVDLGRLHREPHVDAGTEAELLARRPGDLGHRRTPPTTGAHARRHRARRRLRRGRPDVAGTALRSVPVQRHGAAGGKRRTPRRRRTMRRRLERHAESHRTVVHDATEEVQPGDVGGERRSRARRTSSAVPVCTTRPPPR